MRRITTNYLNLLGTLASAALALYPVAALADDGYSVSTPAIVSPSAAIAGGPKVSVTTTTTYVGNPVPEPETMQATQKAAAQTDEKPVVRQSGNITYVTGGVGDDERSQMDAVKKDYNLHIMIAGKAGEFFADNQIRIRDPKGEEVVSDANTGPLFFANLPAGNYTVEAGNGDKVKTQKITIRAANPTSIVFSL